MDWTHQLFVHFMLLVNYLLRIKSVLDSKERRSTDNMSLPSQRQSIPQKRIWSKCEFGHYGELRYILRRFTSMLVAWTKRTKDFWFVCLHIIHMDVNRQKDVDNARHYVENCFRNMVYGLQFTMLVGTCWVCDKVVLVSVYACCPLFMTLNCGMLSYKTAQHVNVIL